MADSSELYGPIAPPVGKDSGNSTGSTFPTLICEFRMLPLELNWCHFQSMCTRSSCFVKEEKYD
jgi:hypothetical protein